MKAVLVYVELAAEYAGWQIWEGAEQARGQSKGHTDPPRPGVSPAPTPPYQIPPSELVPANYAGQPVEGRGSHLDKFPD